nr:protein YOP1-like [Microcebus murinus]
MGDTVASNIGREEKAEEKLRRSPHDTCAWGGECIILDHQIPGAHVITVGLGKRLHGSHAGSSPLIFGTLYPAYYSYKAVKSKDIKEYVKWMMYWIIFALFTTAETFTDIFLCW